MVVARSALLAIAALMLASPGIAATPIAGKWLTADGNGIIEIAPCGAQLCGKIVKLLAKIEGPATDRNNPQVSLRNRPLQGLNILSGFKDTGKHWEGTIYSPERGKSYRSVVKRNTDGTLSVKGCIGPFCQNQTWKPTR